MFDTEVRLQDPADILITRRFSAPVANVFLALTDAALVKLWWAPRSRGTIHSVAMDCRVGGRWRCVMHTHRGEEVGFSGEYLVVQAPTHFVYTEIFDPFPESPSTITVDLSEASGITTVVMRCSYASAQVRDMVIGTGMEDGMRESMRQLTEAVATLASRAS